MDKPVEMTDKDWKYWKPIQQKAEAYTAIFVAREGGGGGDAVKWKSNAITMAWIDGYGAGNAEMRWIGEQE